MGKGFFLDKVKGATAGYDIYSASKLIEWYQPSTDSGYKRVSNVNSNQDLLIMAINEIQNSNQKHLILDGHLCIFNAEGQVERIPQYFFEQIQIEGIVLLQDAPQKICNRIKKRDATEISIYDIERMQNEEKKYARELNANYHIKYEIITHKHTDEKFAEILRIVGGNCIE